LFGLFGLFLLFGFIIRQDLQDYRDSFAVLSASGLQPRWAYAPAWWSWQKPIPLWRKL